MSEVLPRLQQAVCGVGEPLQGGRFGQRGRVAALGECPGGRRANCDCGRRGQKPIEIVFAEGVFQLVDCRGASESYGADASACDPGAAILDVEGVGGLGAVGLNLYDFGAELL